VFLFLLSRLSSSTRRLWTIRIVPDVFTTFSEISFCHPETRLAVFQKERPGDGKEEGDSRVETGREKYIKEKSERRTHFPSPTHTTF
jgi:hypothetical protein